MTPASDSLHLFRTGIGFDAHAYSLDRDRPMWLAGLHWPNEAGIEAHSDGDVAAHAICDALFSAANLGDLGSNFGVDRPEFSQSSGAQLLAETLKRVNSAGFAVSNVSVQVIGNRPKLGSRREEAQSALSLALGGARVSVSATTTDGLGFTGEGQGVAAIASALIFPNDRKSEAS